jgi:hypothetical protein
MITGYLLCVMSINSEIFHKNSKNHKMKKLFIVLAVASLGFVSCSNESTSEEQKRIDDSIAAKKTQDSIDALKPMEPVGPTPAEIEAKRIADSTHVADSIKNAKKPAKK